MSSPNETPVLSLLVIYCSDIEKSRTFYQGLGLSFVAEQHDKGPKHYSTKQGELVIELYPAKSKPTQPLRLVFILPDYPKITYRMSLGHNVKRMSPNSSKVRDPDNNWVILQRAKDTDEQ